MKKIERIRSGSGVGDNIYLYSIVKHLVSQGRRLEVATKWPMVFKEIKSKVSLIGFTKENAQIVAHYTNRKGKPGTDQFQDMCINAKVEPDIPLELDWTILNRKLTDSILEKANGRKILYVQMPRTPMGRQDGFGWELLPDCSVMDKILAHRGDYFAVVRGSGNSKFKLKNIDHQVITTGNVSDVIDIGKISDLFLGQVGQIIPMSESFNKKCLIVWANKGLNSQTLFVKQITHEKVLHKKSSMFVIDNWPDEKVLEVAKRFFE